MPLDVVPPYLGAYKFIRTLGTGSFSTVKLAVHESTGIKVAIKILNRAQMKEMKMEKKVQTEMDILRMFRHPHVIRLYEVIYSPDYIYVVTELASHGELLHRIIAKGRLEESEARILFHRIVAGVEYCHYNMVVHRDLKPENLLLDSEGMIKVADFGLSNRIHDGRFLVTSCGSPNYAAPEVVSGNQYGGPEVDIWSCGIILYAMLCGTLPFEDTTLRGLFRKIKAGVFTFPPHVSPDAREFISRLLVVSPVDRATIDQIRRHPWFQVDIPASIALPFEDTSSEEAVNQRVFAEVVTMGHKASEVSNVLKMGRGLLTEPMLNQQDVDNRNIAVIYNLLYDLFKKTELTALDRSMASGPQASLPLASSAGVGAVPAALLRQVAPMSFSALDLAQRRLAFALPSLPTLNSLLVRRSWRRAVPKLRALVPESPPMDEPDLPLSLAPTEWRLGITVKNIAPYVLLQCIAKALIQAGMVWKMKNFFTFKAVELLTNASPETDDSWSMSDLASIYTSSSSASSSAASSSASSAAASAHSVHSLHCASPGSDTLGSVLGVNNLRRLDLSSPDQRHHASSGSFPSVSSSTSQQPTLSSSPSPSYSRQSVSASPAMDTPTMDTPSPYPASEPDSLPDLMSSLSCTPYPLAPADLPTAAPDSINPEVFRGSRADQPAPMRRPPVCIMVQVWQASTHTDPNNLVRTPAGVGPCRELLVDIRKISGPSFIFAPLCGKITRHITMFAADPALLL